MIIFMDRQPLVDLDLIFEVSRSHSDTFNTVWILWSTRRTDLYLTTHNTTDRYSWPSQDPSPQFQQVSGRKPTPQYSTEVNNKMNLTSASSISFLDLHSDKFNYSVRKTTLSNFDVLLTVHLSIFFSAFNQLDAQNLFHNKFLFHASTCFEHHVLIIRRSKLHYTAFWYHHTETSEWSRITKILLS